MQPSNVNIKSRRLTIDNFFFAILNINEAIQITLIADKKIKLSAF